jgi:hypothetical protein
MMQAGAKAINWSAITGEWVPDYTSPERQAITDVYLQRGGSAALMADYVIAQVTAGLVKAPSFGAAPVKAASR